MATMIASFPLTNTTDLLPLLPPIANFDLMASIGFQSFASITNRSDEDAKKNFAFNYLKTDNECEKPIKRSIEQSK
jgi:hypothetical protein